MSVKPVHIQTLYLHVNDIIISHDLKLDEAFLPDLIRLAIK